MGAGPLLQSSIESSLNRSPRGKKPEGMQLKGLGRLTISFVIHATVGAVLLASLAGIAWVIWVFTKFLEAHNLPEWMVLTCHGFADLLFSVDIITALFVVIVTAMRFIKEVIDYYRGGQ